jgi:hypothetical protein
VTIVSVTPALVVAETRTRWGHQARCECGWTGPVRLTRSGATLDGLTHLSEPHERTA